MIVPRPQAALFAAALAIPLLFAAWSEEAPAVALAGDVFLVLCCLVDAAPLRRAAVRLVTPEESAVAAGGEAVFRYRLENRGARPVHVSLAQPFPPGWRGDGTPVALRLDPGEASEAEFRAFPPGRGRLSPFAPDLRVRSAAGWCELRRNRESAPTVLVYPSGDGAKAAERLRHGRGVAPSGVRLRRQAGPGSEFERLRAYEPDDDFRHLNWKATARAGKPISNVYQVERGRDVVLCLDTGRMMGQAAAGGAVLDLAAEAGLSLSRAVEASGDRLGFVEFRDRVTAFLPPRTGRTNAMRVAGALAAAASTPTHTSFSALAAALGDRQKRRALVVLLTDLNDPQLADDLARALARLRRRHAVLVVGVADPALEKAAAAGPGGSRAGLYLSLAASRFCLDRAVAAREIRKLGVDLVEASGPEIAVRAVERYLRVKAARMLD
ncbi:MAG: DUF58 domain-containing protein [Planctomycetota bacterium]|jgi:uncharacterized protein (DUF58 family)|nr:DUF58 domain-containing protein [Planctomycetota bacterium]